ncbi:MAG: hypothetical protein U0R44_01455 [Candidatus Micrarchaeia archaeon]
MRYAFLAMALLLALQGCAGSRPADNQTGAGPSEESCLASGGSWNTEGTCCRDLPPGQVCNKFCVAVCQCGGIAGFRCPAGYACTDYYPDDKTPDAMGVCKKISR